MTSPRSPARIFASTPPVVPSEKRQRVARRRREIGTELFERIGHRASYEHGELGSARRRARGLESASASVDTKPSRSDCAEHASPPGRRPSVHVSFTPRRDRRNNAVSQDTLSDVLRTVRLRSAVFYYVSCDGRWCAEAPASREIAAAVMPDAEHVIEYHVLTSGEAWAAHRRRASRSKCSAATSCYWRTAIRTSCRATPKCARTPSVDCYFELGRSAAAISHPSRQRRAARRSRRQAAADRRARLPPRTSSAGSSAATCGRSTH